METATAPSPATVALAAVRAAAPITIDTNIQRPKSLRLKVELLEDKIINLTIEKAREFLALLVFEEERNAGPAHVQLIFDEMASGRFLGEQATIVVAVLGDKRYRLNGQHTCLARTFMPDNYNCRVRYLLYRVPNETQLHRLYSVIDPSCASRSPHHLMRVALCGTKAAESIPSHTVSRVASAFKFWKHGDTKTARRLGVNETAADVQAQADLFNTVARFYSRYSKVPHVHNRMGVVAAMLECWDKKPSLAAGFWKPVCDSIGLKSARAPQYALWKWLEKHSVHSTRSRKKKQVTSTEEMYRVCIQAWNYWRDGKEVDPKQGLRATAKRIAAK